MVVCCSGVVTSFHSFPGQFNLLSGDACKLSKRASELVVEEGVFHGLPKRMSQMNLSVESENISAGVRPVNDFPSSLFGLFRVPQAWHSLHHFSTSARSRPQ
ncbi:hypothetical protein AVEN_255587-1 [Araneus ventricosus]|uniref:Uncharacterized protein n=1 Tax=Araneus ventricosus TaxID=182803 RepID=A0A4Y2L2L4_ARAVE|nr:hypothetical protein AVEN_255587-1 [Araneus ventricosus]